MVQNKFLEQFDYTGQLKHDSNTLNEVMAERFLVTDEFIYLQFNENFDGKDTLKFAT